MVLALKLTNYALYDKIILQKKRMTQVFQTTNSYFDQLLDVK